MILGLIFSKDRAMQLDATLSSFLLHGNDISGARWVVLYKATSALYRSQYAVLEKRYREYVSFIEETQFRRQLLDVLKEGRSSDPRENRHGFGSFKAWRNPSVVRPQNFVLFLVDDNIFIRSFRLDEVVHALTVNLDAIGFSLRLGRNTTRCYTLNRSQSLPNFQLLQKDILKFNWTHADADFAYPLELSSSVYPLETVLHLVSRMDFDNPNTLERGMAVRARRLAGRFPFLLCFAQSITFCNPINRVQEVYQNRSGGKAEFTTERLAVRFEQGQRIDIRSLAGFIPDGCHQEVELTFEGPEKQF